MTQYAIESHELTKQYSGKAGCREITLNVPRGVVYGFLGPNGAGKSTFVRTLLGLLQPTRGTGSILGHNIGSVESRRSVGYLPELFRYPDWLTGRQLLEVHADLTKVSREVKKHRVMELLEKVGLKGRGHEKIRGYSKGMQQRIGIACALISDPEVVFFDEPTSALDPIGRKEVRELIAELRDQGKTVFLNSHLLAEVENVCDQVAIIHKSEMVIEGDWRKLLAVQAKIDIVTSQDIREMTNQLPEIVLETELLREERERFHYLLALNSEDDIPQVITHLSLSGASIYQVTLRQPHLEDVFMFWVNKREEQLNLCG